MFINALQQMYWHKNIYILTLYVGLFLGNSFDFLENSDLTRVVVTNSVQPSGERCSKLKVLSVAPFLAEVSKTSIYNNLSKNTWYLFSEQFKGNYLEGYVCIQICRPSEEFMKSAH